MHSFYSVAETACYWQIVYTLKHIIPTNATLSHQVQVDAAPTEDEI